MFLLVDLWIARFPAHGVASAFHFSWVELLPRNQLQTTHQGLSKFNNKNLGLSSVKIDRDLGFIRDSFYCFKIAHCHWGNGQMPWCNCHWLFTSSKLYIRKLDMAWKRAAYLCWPPAQTRWGTGCTSSRTIHPTIKLLVDDYIAVGLNSKSGRGVRLII